MTPAISVSNISKRFRIPLDRSTTLKYRLTHPRSSGRFYSLFALNDVSFDVQAGEFVGIIGSNGCGKSTLLKVIAGIYPPSSGKLAIDGRVSPFLELGVGFNPELTARENVFVNGAILGLTRRELRERFDAIIEFADLDEFVDQKLKNFSSGMQVRLAFSVAIQANAQILLMDEVLAVGDARFQEKCFEVFWRYKREGRTVVLVTHDLGSVESYCDRAILLDHGHLLADGNSTEVTGRYRRMVEESFSGPSQTPAGGEGFATSVERYGSGEVVITKVRILDVDGKPVQAVRSGSAMAMQIEFQTNADVGEIVCGMALHRADGLHISGSNTHVAGITVPCPPVGTRGAVTYVVDNLPLIAGSYLLSAAIHDRHSQHAYDEMWLAFPLRVTEDVKGHGLVDLQGQWSLAASGHRFEDPVTTQSESRGHP